ncbi:hypothetical protein J6590_042735 [Homalodisca vitripennis]|nr:hypothetical protein J6590_042735 [Homalodisca vitripennis]
MNAYYLRRHENEYELKLRGLATTGNANQLRSRLSQAFLDNVEIKEDVISNLNAETELEECEEKFNDLSKLVEDYEGNTKDNEYRRLSARLWHLYLRVERIPVDLDWDKDTAEKKDDLLQRSKHMLDTFLSLSSKVAEKLDGVEEHAEKLDGAEEKKASEDTSVNTAEEGGTSQGANTETPPSQGNVNRKNIAQEKHLPPLGHAGQGISTMVENRKLKSDQSCIEAETAKPIPVFKWGLQFSNGPGQSIGAFLQRVEELRYARGVSEA